VFAIISVIEGMTAAAISPTMVTTTMLSISEKPERTGLKREVVQVEGGVTEALGR
jgi:hypothetical protein